MTTDFYIVSGSTVPKDYFWDIGNPLETTPTYIVADSTTTYISGYAPGLKVVFKSDIKDLIYAGFPDVSANYIWNFGDYYNSVDNTITLNCVDSTVEHTYILPGKYSVSLTNIQSKEDQPELPSSDIPCGGRHKIGWYWDNLDCGDLQATTWDETNCTLPQVADLKKRKPKKWDDEGKCFQRYCKNWTWKDLNCVGRNPVFWYETYEYGDYYKRWKYEANNIACNPRDIPKVTVDVTEQVALKPFIVEVLEVKPTAIITCESYPLTGYSPFTYKLSPAQIKTGSFPIDRIDWDPGDGSSIKTATRYTTPDSGYFVYNNIYFSDTNDPRNYDFIYTLKRNSDTYPVFYPSLTCYSASTNTSDNCSIVVGLIHLQPQNTDIQLLKAKTTSKGDFYGIEVDKNVTVLSTLTENEVVASPVPTVPPSPVKFLTKQTPVIYFGNTSEGYPPPYEPGCEYIPSEPTLFNLIREETDPTFLRDFAVNKTLNHGIGPDITFTRSSSATYFDSNGILQTVGNNIPRFDHDPATAGNPSRGLLIEESRTNSIRNSQAGGSTNGVIGSGGVMPTYWTTSGHNTNGISAEILGTGTEDGLSYIDLKVSGTPTSNGVLSFNTESITQIVAADGQTWTGSTYTKLQAGATTNATFRGYVTGRTSGGSAIAGQASTVTFVPTSAKLNSQRITSTRTFSDATVARVTYNFEVIYTNGNPIDLTLRIAAPQLEQGAFPTSYIPTTSAAATRAADSAVVTPISSFYNQSEGTLFAEYLGAKTATSSRVIVDIDDNTLGNRVSLVGNGSGLIPQASVTTAGSNVFNSTIGASPSASDIIKLIAGCKTNDFIACRNGSLGTDDTSGAMPSVLTHLYIGQFVSAHINGHIRKIAYWPERLPDERLQQLTQSDEIYYSILNVDDSILLEDETLLYK